MSEHCWLCTRPIGTRVEWHHPVPKSRGGRETVAVHPICHRTIHATFSNAELAKAGREAIVAHPEMTRFLSWIANKPADFHAPTRRKKQRRDKLRHIFRAADRDLRQRSAISWSYRKRSPLPLPGTGDRALPLPEPV